MKDIQVALELQARLNGIAKIIEIVDNRCLAADGPVIPTLEEMTAKEIQDIYRLAKVGRAKVDFPPRPGTLDRVNRTDWFRNGEYPEYPGVYEVIHNGNVRYSYFFAGDWTVFADTPEDAAKHFTNLAPTAYPVVWRGLALRR